MLSVTMVWFGKRDREVLQADAGKSCTGRQIDEMSGCSSGRVGFALPLFITCMDFGMASVVNFTMDFSGGALSFLGRDGKAPRNPQISHKIQDQIHVLGMKNRQDKCSVLRNAMTYQGLKRAHVKK